MSSQLSLTQYHLKILIRFENKILLKTAYREKNEVAIIKICA